MHCDIESTICRLHEFMQMLHWRVISLAFLSKTRQRVFTANSTHFAVSYQFFDVFLLVIGVLFLLICCFNKRVRENNTLPCCFVEGQFCTTYRCVKTTRSSVWPTRWRAQTTRLQQVKISSETFKCTVGVMWCEMWNVDFIALEV